MEKTISALVEQIKGESAKPKTEVCPGLKVVQEGNENWAAFQIFTYVKAIRQVGEAQGLTLVQTWKSEVMDMVPTHAPQHPKQQIQRRQAAMHYFTNCRDDLARWMA